MKTKKSRARVGAYCPKCHGPHKVGHGKRKPAKRRRGPASTLDAISRGNAANGKELRRLKKELDKLGKRATGSESRAKRSAAAVKGWARRRHISVATERKREAKHTPAKHHSKRTVKRRRR